MDDLIVELLRKYPEGKTSAFIHETVTDPYLTLVETENRLDDLMGEARVVLAFIEGQTVYAIA